MPQDDDPPGFDDEGTVVLPGRQLPPSSGMRRPTPSSVRRSLPPVGRVEHGETEIGPPPLGAGETAVGPPPPEALAPPPRTAAATRPRSLLVPVAAVAVLMTAVAIVSVRGRIEFRRIAALAIPSATPTPRPIPSDPPLTPEVRALMRTGEQEERDGRFARARWNYWEAFKQSGRECFSCFLKLRTLEARMVAEIDAALAAGEKDLSVGNWDEAIRQFEKVQRLDPDPDSLNHRNAARGIAQAQQGKPER